MIVLITQFNIIRFFLVIITIYTIIFILIIIDIFIVGHFNLIIDQSHSFNAGFKFEKLDGLIFCFLLDYFTDH